MTDFRVRGRSRALVAGEVGVRVGEWVSGG